ncbi:MAG: right-handed parallel beta-helix repeat-containing protein [Anaerolineaceae bacterium]
MRIKITIIVLISLMASACSALIPGRNVLPDVISPGGTIYYIRPDGGDTQQCNGQADIPYSGSGQDQACAWDHPFRALPPGGPARIEGGDTLIIASGSYRLGYGAPGAESPALCNPDNPWDCRMSPVPAGPDPQHPTLILGEGWNTGCPTPPEVWGAERASRLFDLTRTSNAVIACLELTDHATCADGHPNSDLSCQRGSFPYGEWASVGLYAEDSENIWLRDLNIHGLASAGIHAGRLADWRIENTRLAGNGWVGWYGDLWQGSDSNSGTLKFSHWLVEWNGCVESFPDEQPTGCWAQPARGYGDGVGTGETGGHWIIEDSAFLHNTSDGLDLLYGNHNIKIEIRRSRAEGNAGNQIKTRGVATIENTIVVGNCAFFMGKPFTASGDFNGDGQIESAVEDCRAFGNALSFDLWRGNRITVTNASITGQGDCLVIAQCSEGEKCEGNERVIMRNDLFIGQPDFTNPSEASCLSYSEDLSAATFEVDYSLIFGVKEDVCPGNQSICGKDPQILISDLSNFTPKPLKTSPLIDAAHRLNCPATDINGHIRPQGGGCDIGAIEFLFENLYYLPLVGK